MKAFELSERVVDIAYLVLYATLVWGVAHLCGYI
jgi:hypothetical protein